MNKKKVAITIGLMCFLLTFGIVMQINTIKEANKTVGNVGIENGLRDEVLRWKERYDYTYSSLLREQKELEKTRTDATKNDANSKDIEEQLKLSNKLLGLTDVTGPGIIITIADNDTSPKGLGAIDPNYLLVHSTDILRVVNELKNAGAEAISINGERIVTTTSVTCDGNVVLINGQKIGSPFIIKAIGLPEMLTNIDRPSGYLELMREGGVETSIRKADNMTIEKYSGVLSSKYLRKD